MEDPRRAVADIEDADAGLGPKRVRKTAVLPKRAPRVRIGAGEGPSARPGSNAKVQQDSFVPGVGTVFVRTWGCSHNNSDGEYMAGLLAAAGYTIAAEPADADVWILNSCTVKTPSEDGFNNSIRDAKAAGKHVVVAGCVPQGQQSSKWIDGLSIVGVQQIDRVCEAVEETLRGNTIRLVSNKRVAGKKAGGASLDLPKIRKNPLIEIVPINTGCLNACTYCKTKHARGDLGSYPPDEIVSRIQSVLQEGVVEIWLTSEDTGAYGRDIDSSLPELLWRIVEVLPEGTMLRLGMTNPPYILDHLDEIVKVMAHPRVYSFLHVPVQAGSDEVLAAMKREYTRADFCHVVDTLRAGVPGVSIATDIICGFPGETPDDFEDTMTLCQKYKFPSLFINQFFPRPGTPAARMERVDPREVKRRTKRLSEFFRSYLPYTGREGAVLDVLVTEIASDKKHFVGHTKRYEQVLLAPRDDIMGKLVQVRIVKTTKFSMEGELIEESVRRAPVRPKPTQQLQHVVQRQRARGQSLQGVETNAEATAAGSTSWAPSWIIVVAVLLLLFSWIPGVVMAA
eukprot:m.487038 g.487038  ORF g.487038 m.487038 type:complete len:566 (+) comp24759_c0_seq1:252-1949(+)